MDAKSRLNQPSTNFHLVIHVGSQLRSVLQLLKLATNGIGVLVIRAVANEFDTILKFIVIPQQIGEV